MCICWDLSTQYINEQLSLHCTSVFGAKVHEYEFLTGVVLVVICVRCPGSMSFNSDHSSLSLVSSVFLLCTADFIFCFVKVDLSY